MRETTELAQYARDLGQDIRFIQAQGGNMSFKSHDQLWVKASGVYMRDMTLDSFSHIHLSECAKSLADQQYSLTALNGKRPSIEVLLHAFLTKPYVVHVHAVWSMALGCLTDMAGVITTRMAAHFATNDWVIIDYATPGWPLARLVSDTIGNPPTQPRILFLKNHGLVLAGNSLGEIDATLKTLTTLFEQTPIAKTVTHTDIPTGYIAVPSCLNAAQKQLTDAHITLARGGAFYPDQVVFLGPKIGVFGDNDATAGHVSMTKNGNGFITQKPLTRSLQEMSDAHLLLLDQLVAWNLPITYLAQAETDKLANMESEKFRQQLAQSV